MADQPPPSHPSTTTHQGHNPKRGVGLAGDIVGSVSKGLEVGGHRNPVSEIVGTVSDGLKHGAGEQPSRHAELKK
ncbi:hypothetical protein J7T55_010561 [Diaporthe amygdali]|uniref:uncharacterized protein n=1 Tax=Phomopsis amygdali TaxID=1214568 RepID=UPI0022FEC7AA|nr:uncharacterized protein J7T55_010561 [Diaporthe amygdali]KAJ0115738.1 hypothetical protein J7T55_010561 [Diaporthe amygdali]